MCHDCIVKNGSSEKKVSSQYDLSKALKIPIKKLPLCKEYPETALRGKSCLCPIDIEALGKQLGYKTTAPYNDPEQICDEWVMEKINLKKEGGDSLQKK